MLHYEDDIRWIVHVPKADETRRSVKAGRYKTREAKRT